MTAAPAMEEVRLPEAATIQDLGGALSAWARNRNMQSPCWWVVTTDMGNGSPLRVVVGAHTTVGVMVCRQEQREARIGDRDLIVSEHFFNLDVGGRPALPAMTILHFGPPGASGNKTPKVEGVMTSSSPALRTLTSLQELRTNHAGGLQVVLFQPY